MSCSVSAKWSVVQERIISSRLQAPYHPRSWQHQAYSYGALRGQPAAVPVGSAADNVWAESEHSLLCVLLLDAVNDNQNRSIFHECYSCIRTGVFILFEDLVLETDVM